VILTISPHPEVPPADASSRDHPKKTPFIARVALSNFRSYARAELTASGPPVVLAGPNGAGKTNLLEAISLLSPGRGLRGARLSDHTRKGPSEGGLWAIAASVSAGGICHEIGTGLALTPSGAERRQATLNGAPLPSSAELSEILQIVWLTPAMDRLFIESAGARRRFVDRLTLGFDPSHAKTHTRYEAATRERARLLKFGPRDPAWLDGLEDEMARTGALIAQARSGAVSRLNRALAERGSAGAFPSAQLSLSGETEQLLEEHGRELEGELRGRLKSTRMRDAESGRTSIGPHLSDLLVRHTAKRMDARDCSTGEQKALLIAIVLADAWELARRNADASPILLLDEIVAHLDSIRRSALFEEILALGAQAWLTGTDLPVFGELSERAEIFSLSDGQLVRR